MESCLNRRPFSSTQGQNHKLKPQSQSNIRASHFSRYHIKMTLDLNRISSVTAAQPQKCAAGQSQPFQQYNTLFSSSCLQVTASLEEQAFTSAWGLKAKTTFIKALDSLTESEKKLMNKTKVLGSANLPLDEREKVCFSAVIPKSQIRVFICHSSWVI